MDRNARLSVDHGEDGIAVLDSCLIRTFLDNYGDLVRFLARRLRCAFTARDLAQEVYLRAARVDGTTGIMSPRALLFQIAANLATDHQRVEGRRDELLREAHDLLWVEADEVSPERHALAKDELARIEAALLRLPERTRRVFFLNRFEGLTQREVALQLGISRTSVEKHVRRALRCIADAQQTVRVDGACAGGEGDRDARSSQ